MREPPTPWPSSIDPQVGISAVKLASETTVDLSLFARRRHSLASSPLGPPTLTRQAQLVKQRRPLTQYEESTIFTPALLLCRLERPDFPCLCLLLHAAHPLASGCTRLTGVDDNGSMAKSSAVTEPHRSTARLSSLEQQCCAIAARNTGSREGHGERHLGRRV